MKSSPYVITISRELGAGGSYIGKRIAERLGIIYLDREILAAAAKHFNISEGELESLEERGNSLWDAFLRSGAYAFPETLLEIPVYMPTNRELFQFESSIIERTARERSCVIIGRGGSFILQNHPRHLSVFLHADKAFRLKRVQELFHLSQAAADELIEQTDKDRARYIHAATGQDWKDLRKCHISIDTGIMGLQATEELILDCARTRFGATVSAS